jgi:two-component system chemotaxis response regulator CheB
MHAVLSNEPDMVVTVAADPLIAMQKMKKERPHVILLDLEMPRMDGLTFLRKIMADDPIPTLICSGVAARGTQMALRALDHGAIGIVAKPKIGVSNFLHESALMLIDMVRSAAQARFRRQALRAQPVKNKSAGPHPAVWPRSTASRRMIAIGASTGGTEALTEILTAMPPDAPGIVIVQHMPEHFTAAFANRLNSVCQITVKEAADGDLIRPGHAFVAPGNWHVLVHRSGLDYRIEVNDGPLVSRHRPSVDVLFGSVAKSVGPDAVGVIMTGMGDDGAQGLLEMRNCGAQTIAQDESSCVVFGMPKEAIACGAVTAVVPLLGIAETALKMSTRSR